MDSATDSANDEPRRVLVAPGVFESLARLVDWGQPGPDGFYSPTIYSDAPRFAYLVAGERHTLHVAFRRHGRRYTDEGCNIDAVGDRLLLEFTDEALARQSASRVCEVCF